MTRLYKINSIVAREGRFSPIYTATVYTPEATVRRSGTFVSHPETEIECFFHYGRKEWMGRFVDKYQFLDEKMGCVSNFLDKKADDILRTRLLIQGLEAVAAYGLSQAQKDELANARKRLAKLKDPDHLPCHECRHLESCTDKRIFKFSPAVYLYEGAKCGEVYELASSVAGVVAKLKDPEYPRNLPSDIFSGWRKCMDCKHCKHIHRDNDPDGIDPITGTITIDSETEDVEYVLGLCHPDRKEQRDTRAPQPTLKCRLLIDEDNPQETGWIKWNDTCPDYVWRGYNVNRKLDYTNAFRHIEVTDDGNIVCGNVVAVGVCQ